MLRGVSFEVPNDYGTILYDMLKPIDITKFEWLYGGGESYRTIKNDLGDDLFPKDDVIVGTELDKLLREGSYYIIFADLKAFPQGKHQEIMTYGEFSQSDCELVVLIVDSCNVDIYCKDKFKLDMLYKNALEQEYKDVEYITDEDDGRNLLECW